MMQPKWGHFLDSGPKGGHLEHKLAEAPSLIYVARDSHKVFANTCHNLQKDTTFGESNTHLSNIFEEYVQYRFKSLKQPFWREIN